MTDQTESEEPLTPAECVEYLDDIVANNAAGARNLAIPIELLSDSAAAIRALEAKVREKDREIEVREATTERSSLTCDSTATGSRGRWRG